MMALLGLWRRHLGWRLSSTAAFEALTHARANYMRRYVDDRRATARAAGYCTACYIRPAQDGYLSCRRCLKKAQASQRRQKTARADTNQPKGRDHAT